MLSNRSEVMLLNRNFNREKPLAAYPTFTHPSYANTTRDPGAYDLMKATLVGSAMRTFHALPTDSWIVIGDDPHTSQCPLASLPGTFSTNAKLLGHLDVGLRLFTV